MAVKPTDTKVQSAAAPSPFPPIADYAFLSNCHTGALVAADGAIDWLCVPSFDSPSSFGSLLDREAGFFRLAPFGINHPTARAYIPGTNILETTWKTPNGWIVVRDALTMGPRESEDTITPHTRPPADDDADHMLVRTVECLEGSVEVELVCEPAFDYGRVPAEWSRSGATATPRMRMEPGRRSGSSPTSRSGSRAIAFGPARAQPRRSRLLRPLVGRGAGGAEGRRRGERADRRRPRGSGAPGCGGRGSRTTAGATRSSGRRSRSRASPTCRPAHGGRADDVAAGDPGRRAQLGLPLHLDP